ncbi:MAG: hypothetical protein ACM3Q1_13280 [Bacteroidales bacterium]
MNKALRILSVVAGILVTGAAVAALSIGLCISVLVGLPALDKPSFPSDARQVLMVCVAAIVAAFPVFGLGIYICQWGLRQRRCDIEAKAEEGRQ